MSKIPQDTIDKLMEAAKIEEIIEDSLGKYDRHNQTGLKKKGVRYQCLCPWHDDKHLGSFVVYPKGNCYKCFVCGAKGGVIDWLMDYEHLSYKDALRYLGKKYSIDVDDAPFNYVPPPPRPAPPPLPTLVLPKHLMAGTLLTIDQDPLVQWIRHWPYWDEVQRRRVDEMIGLYNVGHGKNGHTIFWQIDDNGRVRTGKMMKYYPADHPKAGHRDKEASWSFDFIHATLIRHWDAEHQEMTDEPPYPFPHLYDPDKQEMRQCYFGMHLVDKWKRKDVEQAVCLVESEKTALLMAIAYGNHAKQVWMATGGLENINRDKLQPLIDRGRRLIFYPDRDGIDKWQKKVDALGYDRAIIDTRAVTQWWRPEDGPKADIADVVMRCLSHSRELKTINEVKREMPQASVLIDKLNLEPTKQ